MDMVKAGIAIASAFLLLSCSDGGSSTGTSNGGSGGGAVTLDASTIFKGTLTLSGTITLPPGSGAGKSIQLTASGGGADITQKGSQVGLAGTTPGDSVPYTITGLVAGKYSVRARVDMDGNGALADDVDLDGFTGGTVDAPVRDISKAQQVDVGPSGATGVNFGVGKAPN
jgi:hypothetical protein